MPRKLTLSSMHALATLRGFTYHGSSTPGSCKKEIWGCPNGHRWPALYNSIHRGTGCPHCQRSNLRKTMDDMHALAARRGFKCLSTEYKGAFIHLLWECPKRHKWPSTPNCISNGGGCPHCAGNARLTAKGMHALAKSLGLKYLGSDFPKSHMTELWECKNGHQWKAVPNNIKDLIGCPHCYHDLRYHSIATRKAIQTSPPPG